MSARGKKKIRVKLYDKRHILCLFDFFLLYMVDKLRKYVNPKDERKLF